LDAMEDLREYLYKDFRSKARVQELERSYWDLAIELAPKLNLEDRARLYALIWDEAEEFTQLLLQLLRALEKLDYAEELYCAMDSLTPREKSIIDVATLNGLGAEDGGEELAVQTPAGVKTTLPRPVVTALTAELTIVIKDKPADYFDYTDLLDFPGYRSRFKIDDIRRELKKEGMQKEFFLRGKVAYLFQRYCAERELNSMLLCIGPGNQEVQDLPGVINDWVCSTHGEKPEDRVNKAISLLFILTKFDMEFEEKKGAPSVETRWDTRLHASLLDFFGKQHDWPKQWTPQRGFDNLFMLRNPNFKFKSVLTYQGDKETGIQADSLKLVDDLRSSFTRSETVKEHFSDPETAWNEAMRLNDGGISHIRENLSPLCDPAIKQRQLLQNIESNREALERRLQAFYQSDDREELRKQKIQLIAALFTRLSALDKNSRRLSHLIKTLGLPEGFVADLHDEAMRRYRELKEDEANMENLAGQESAEPVDIETVDLGALLGDDDEEIEASATEGEIPAATDEAGFFASYIESKWVKNLHDIAADPAMQKYFGLGEREFSALASELATGVERMKLRSSMSEEFRKAAGFADSRKAGVLNKQAAIATRAFNNYIDWLGFNPRERSEKERTFALPNSKPQTVFSPPPPVEGLPVLEPRGKKGELLYVNRWTKNWLSSLGALIMDNVDFDGKQTINVEENRLLGVLLKKLLSRQGEIPVAKKPESSRQPESARDSGGETVIFRGEAAATPQTFNRE
ncbi:MAG: putative virulence factor, partial [Desulfovibrio sp.]|nr:putative virulence factor [Desulfovibrio sp.]